MLTVPLGFHPIPAMLKTWKGPWHPGDSGRETTIVATRPGGRSCWSAGIKPHHCRWLVGNIARRGSVGTRWCQGANAASPDPLHLPLEAVAQPSHKLDHIQKCCVFCFAISTVATSAADKSSLHCSWPREVDGLFKVQCTKQRFSEPFPPVNL